MSVGAVPTCLSCGRPVDQTTRMCDDCRSTAGAVVIDPRTAPQPRDDRGAAQSRRSRRNAVATGSAAAVGAPERTAGPGAGAAALGAGAAALGAGAASLGAGPAVLGAGPAVLGAGPAVLGAGPAVLGDAFAGAPPAGPARRLAAFAVDSAVVVAAAAVAFAVTRSTLIAALVLAELVVGVTVWEARTGRTFGNLLLGLRSARVEAPFALGSPRAGSRALVVLAGAAVAGVGQWFVVGSSAFDRTPLRQGWHDKVGRSVVVDVRAERASSGAPAGAVAPVLTSAAPPALTRAHASVPAPTPPPAAATTRVAAPSVPVPPAPARSVAVPPVAAPPIAVPPVAAPAIPASAVPAPAGPQAAPSPRPATAFVLTLDDGRWTEVRGPGVVGRSPQVAADERYDHVVTIDDTTRSVSRTHARFGVSPAGFWVQDAGSGNGTIVVLPDGRAVLAPQGARTPVPVGATVRLGERTFTVTEVPHVQ